MSQTAEAFTEAYDTDRGRSRPGTPGHQAGTLPDLLRTAEGFGLKPGPAVGTRLAALESLKAARTKASHARQKAEQDIRSALGARRAADALAVIEAAKKAKGKPLDPSTVVLGEDYEETAAKALADVERLIQTLSDGIKTQLLDLGEEWQGEVYGEKLRRLWDERVVFTVDPETTTVAEAQTRAAVAGEVATLIFQLYVSHVGGRKSMSGHTHKVLRRLFDEAVAEGAPMPTIEDAREVIEGQKANTPAARAERARAEALAAKKAQEEALTPSYRTDAQRARAAKAKAAK